MPLEPMRQKKKTKKKKVKIRKWKCKIFVLLDDICHEMDKHKEVKLIHTLHGQTIVFYR